MHVLAHEAAIGAAEQQASVAAAAEAFFAAVAVARIRQTLQVSPTGSPINQI